MDELGMEFSDKSSIQYDGAAQAFAFVEAPKTEPEGPALAEAQRGVLKLAEDMRVEIYPDDVNNLKDIQAASKTLTALDGVKIPEDYTVILSSPGAGNFSFLHTHTIYIDFTNTKNHNKTALQASINELVV